MAHANPMFQKTEAKPEFTDYKVAITPDGEVNALVLRALYEADRAYIRTGRSLRKIARGFRDKDPIAIRRGYPKKRQRDEDIPSKRGVPHSNFLKQFKIVEKAVRTSSCFDDVVYTAKIYVLHATRGWKFYA